VSALTVVALHKSPIYLCVT